ncbi:unnamed protein product, partial [Polarella glacialis]
FLELHGGVRSGMEMAQFLDLKHRMEAQAQLSEVQERIQSLLVRAGAAGVVAPPASAPLASAGPASSVGEHRCLTSTGGVAEVLTLEESEPPAAPRPASAGELQENIASIQEDLRQFSSELDDFNKLISEKASGSRLRFAPPSRGEARPSTGEASPSSAADEAAEAAAALEVAKRSSWYRAPPPALPSDVPMIEVHHSIRQRVITRSHSRPRTAQPAMFIMNPGFEE